MVNAFTHSATLHIPSIISKVNLSYDHLDCVGSRVKSDLGLKGVLNMVDLEDSSSVRAAITIVDYLLHSGKFDGLYKFIFVFLFHFIWP